MRIIYLTPLVPASSGSGGRRAIYNHVVDLGSAASAKVRLFCVDVEGIGERPELPHSIEVKTFPRAFPRVGGRPSPFRLFSAGLQLLANCMPRSVAVTASAQAVDTLGDTLSGDDIDCVVVDHFFAAGLISQIPAIRAPLIYVAHNYEAEIWRDRFQAERRWVRKLIAGIEWHKTKKAERRLIRRATAVITLTQRDRANLDALIAYRPSAVWPELSARKVARWHHPRKRTMLFVGSAAYFPNEDAIHWLLDSLMPRVWMLDQGITLRLVGTARTDLLTSSEFPNVEFLGFVSDAQLEQAYLESALFICPVVLGSGIKIKVVEALSYGMPVALTEESCAGIESVQAVQRFTRNDPDAVARDLVGLLSDADRLQRMSAATAQAYDAALAAKLSMEDLLKTLIAQAAGDHSLSMD